MHAELCEGLGVLLFWADAEVPMHACGALVEWLNVGASGLFACWR